MKALHEACSNVEAVAAAAATAAPAAAASITAFQRATRSLDVTMLALYSSSSSSRGCDGFFDVRLNGAPCMLQPPANLRAN